jgi:hypothetical protein
MYNIIYETTTTKKKDEDFLGTSLAVQWLRLNASNAGDTGSISCWGTKILYATLVGSKKN